MRILILAVSTLVLLGLAVGVVRGQAASKLFDAVPVANRESLRDASSKVVSYEINREWAEMYKLYDNKKRITLQQFTRDMNKQVKLVAFRPTAVTYIPPSADWRIDGCAVFDFAVVDARTVDAEITARHFSDGWRLSEVVISPRKGPQRCTAEKK